MISDYFLENVNMSYSADTSGLLQSGPYIGILGNNILEKFNVLFDFKNRNLYLKPNEDFSKPYVFDRVGFSFVDRYKTHGGWIVTGLTENSPAEKQGLRIDDKILFVNEIPVEKISKKSQKGYFDKFDEVDLVVSRTDSIKNISFGLSPLIK